MSCVFSCLMIIISMHNCCFCGFMFKQRLQTTSPSSWQKKITTLWPCHLQVCQYLQDKVIHVTYIKYIDAYLVSLICSRTFVEPRRTCTNTEGPTQTKVTNNNNNNNMLEIQFKMKYLSLKTVKSY